MKGTIFSTQEKFLPKLDITQIQGHIPQFDNLTLNTNVIPPWKNMMVTTTT